MLLCLWANSGAIEEERARQVREGALETLDVRAAERVLLARHAVHQWHAALLAELRRRIVRLRNSVSKPSSPLLLLLLLQLFALLRTRVLKPHL